MLPMGWISAACEEHQHCLSETPLTSQTLADSRKHSIGLAGSDGAGAVKVVKRRVATKKKLTKAQYAEIKTHLLTQSKKMDLQTHDYGTEERAEFEKVEIMLCQDTIARGISDYGRTFDKQEPSNNSQELDALTKAEVERLTRFARSDGLPRLLYRVASHQGPHGHTNGHDELTEHFPAAEKNHDQACAAGLVDEHQLSKKDR